MRKKNILGKTGLTDKHFDINKVILNVAKQRKQIIYGARSIEAQAGLLSRDTKDWDAFDSNPKKASKVLQKKLDKLVGFDHYYSKPAMHKGTWKVRNRGNDGLKGTEDDEDVADYSKPTEKVAFVTKKGIRYRILKTELKKKISTVADPEFEFRHKKDKDDINRIRSYLKIKSIVGGSV